MNFDTMTNEELDAEMATRIMGYKRCTDWPGPASEAPWEMEDGNLRDVAEWQPADCWSDAHEAIDAMREKGYAVQLNCWPKICLVYVLRVSTAAFPSEDTKARTVEPRIVCIALLKAAEAEREREKAESGADPDA